MNDNEIKSKDEMSELETPSDNLMNNQQRIVNIRCVNV